jgi:hypothetical protein
MALSIPKDASDVSEDNPSEEEDASELFPNQEKDSESAALVTAGPLANLKADFESQKAVFESRETLVVLPDHEPENNKEIAEAQIVDTAPETATLCGQPRWLIFAFLGVLGTIAIGASLGVALGNSGDDPQLSDRGIELQNRIIDEIPSSQFGLSQRQVLNWLANEDPAMLDFETTPFGTILERYAMVTLYYSLNGPQWEDQDGFLSEKSVCSWGNVTCDPMITEIFWFSNNLHGQLPTELGLLTGLQSLDLCKFATVFSSELDTIPLLGSVLQFISCTVL